MKFVNKKVILIPAIISSVMIGQYYLHNKFIKYKKDRILDQYYSK